MDKALLSDLKKKMLIRSALLALPSLDEILSMNDLLSADEVLLEIIKNALREFEQYYPLILDMKVNRDQLCTCYNMEGYCEIKSNFTLYLDCQLSEDRIILVPNATPMWRATGLSYPIAGSYVYFSDYRRPYIFMSDVPNGEIIIRGLCSRPTIPDFLPDKSFNPESEKAAVYWMNIEEGFRGQLFLDFCMVHLLDMIRQMKASIQLGNFAVDIFSNVDGAYMELRNRVDQTVLTSGWYGDLII